MLPLALSMYLITATNALPVPVGNGAPQFLLLNSTAQIALLWSSISLAVITSFLQGLITTIVAISEDQGMWTFRFRIALHEHMWWTAVSLMLCTSFVLIVISFLAGNSSDSLGVLTLSTATAIAIVRYTIPAWRNRVYVRLRWLSWTGPSRTGIQKSMTEYCGSAADWKRLQLLPRKTLTEPNMSDKWGGTLVSRTGIWEDPTDILSGLSPDEDNDSEKASIDTPQARIFSDGYSNDKRISLLWGEKEGFRRRISRAIGSVPSSLRQSIPSTFDGFGGTGLCLAMGILGRNKGLNASELVYRIFLPSRNAQNEGLRKPNYRIIAELESTSAWYPRPNKVMRSFYQKVMEEQYSLFGAEYVAAAVELSLILLDCPADVCMWWLKHGLEQQSIEVNHTLSRAKFSTEKKPADDAQLRVLYRASYTSMILSINYFDRNQADSDVYVRRPDLSCFACLWSAEVGSAPHWWKDPWVKERLTKEAKGLRDGWQIPASWLLGLDGLAPALDITRWPQW